MKAQRKKGFAAACVALVVFTTVLPACAPPDPPPPTTAPITPTSVATMLVEKAGGIAAGKAAGFVMSVIGLNSLFPDDQTKQLQEIQRQLDGISLQLVQVEESLSTLIGGLADAQLSTELHALQDEAVLVGVLYTEHFKPLLAAASAHRAATDSGDQQRIDDAFTKLIRARNDFYTAYDRSNASALSLKISNRLVPGDATSALAAKGRVLLSRPGARHLTSADSAQIRELYDSFAEYEALAAWMRMERWIPSEPTPPEGTSPGNADIYENARKEYLDRTRREHAGLPPVIPADVVIDAGPGPARTTTNGAAMWQPVASAVRYQPDNRDPGTVPVALDGLNADARRSYGDWQIPTMATLRSLLSGFVPASGSTPGSFLAGLHPSSATWRTIADSTPWPYIWSSDVVTFTGACSTHVNNAPFTHYTVRLHDAVGTSTPTPVPGGRPALPATAYDPDWRTRTPNCDEFVATTFAGPTALGGFLATRTVGASPIDHMAQGGGTYLRPNADLRFADLTTLYLAGLDMSGSDLRGATFVGTDLTDADLSGARLDGVTSSGIVGVPARLPAGWALVDGRLVGPGTTLTGADLSGADLRAVNLAGVRSGGLDCTGCLLPSGWLWSGLPSGYLVHRTADLTGAELVGVDLGAVDLSGADLTGADLSNAHLAASDLAGANLTNARLVGTDLSGARLAGARLTGATLQGARLTGVSSGGIVGTPTLPTGWALVNGHLAGRGALLEGANLDKGDLSSADLTGADLTRASLKAATLTNATLTNVKLTGADITGARFGTDNDNKLAGIVSGFLTGVPAQLPASGRFRIVERYFVGPSANLSGARFSPSAQLGVALSATNFTGAHLNGLNLTGAFLNNANLTDAVLTDTTLTGANLSAATLSGVRSGGIVGTPVLPAGWKVLDGHLVGPGANLVGASLAGADLRDLDLTGADLTGADLVGADLTGADLTGVSLTLADVRNATLTDADITGVSLLTDDDNKLAGIVSGGLVGAPTLLPLSGRVRIVEGYLIGPSANLSGARFSPGAQLGVALSAANFSHADLTGLDLSGAFLNNANLTGAVLTGTTLTGANLSAATLTGVTSGGIVGTPALPAGWSVIDGYLVGPGAVPPA